MRAKRGNAKSNHSTLHSQKGATILLVALLCVSIFGMAALAADIGIVRSEKSKMQYAVDAAALAAVLLTLPNDDGSENFPSTIQAEAYRYAAENGVASLEIQTAMNQNDDGTLHNFLGHWDHDGRQFVEGPEAGSGNYNAVRVSATRDVPLHFASVFNFSTLTPSVEAYAIVDSAGKDTCMMPFGVEAGYLEGLDYGDVLTIDMVDSGNWGVLDICADENDNPNNCMQSPQNFEDAIMGASCIGPVSIGDEVSQGPGVDGIAPCIQWLVDNMPIVTLPVVDDFGNGNDDVNIVGFVEVKFISQSLNNGGGNFCGGLKGVDKGDKTPGNGSHWTAVIQIIRAVEGNGMGGPTSGPYLLSRRLVCTCGDGTANCAKCAGTIFDEDEEEENG